MGSDPGDITASLRGWSQGDPDALSELIAKVEPDLRRAAQFYFEREDSDHTLQPTALVSELCLRLMGRRKVQWNNRKQFFSFAGQLMRRILIDYAKARKTARRGGNVELLSLTGGLDKEREEAIDVDTLLSLHTALAALAEFDPRSAQVVELRFFAGLSGDETAEALGISRSTVTREWTMAKEYLARELGTGAVAPLAAD